MVHITTLFGETSERALEVVIRAHGIAGSIALFDWCLTWLLPGLLDRLAICDDSFCKSRIDTHRDNVSHDDDM